MEKSGAGRGFSVGAKRRIAFAGKEVRGARFRTVYGSCKGRSSEMVNSFGHIRVFRCAYREM